MAHYDYYCHCCFVKSAVVAGSWYTYHIPCPPMASYNKCPVMYASTCEMCKLAALVMLTTAALYRLFFWTSSSILYWTIELECGHTGLNFLFIHTGGVMIIVIQIEPSFQGKQTYFYLYRQVCSQPCGWSQNHQQYYYFLSTHATSISNALAAAIFF